MTKKKSDEASFVDHFVYVFTAPFIQNPMWPMPDRIKNEATLYRLAEVENIRDEKATGWEVMGYLSGQSLCAPLTKEWFNIYMHLFNKYLPNEAKSIDIDTDRELGIHESQLLDRIQRWMFKKQMEHIKAKEKDKEVKRQRTLELEYVEQEK